ncbi:MAG: SIP domain-containing protein, partial [Streptomycetaceae bacterium]|nr:SIP domain-containing protein [Streptomycetaceae bacterium]
AGMVRAVRRNLVRDRGIDRKSVTFTGYWRRGASDDDLLAETLAGGTPHLPGADD